MAKLADRMVIRHLRVSVPDPERRQQVKRGRLAEPLLEQRIRCVAIVGAGASAALMKRGKALADDLEAELDRDEDEARKDEMFRLQRVYGLDPKDFETRLAALSHNPGAEARVRKTIADKYNYRHPTVLGYELLAHLLKHRFIDAIISFNFDELLDQSLDDELGPNEYHRLVSDSDCARAVADPDSSDYLPLYIKLHGTASEPESLRFTREAYFQLPQGLLRVVRSLLAGQLCVVANVGSAMTGFDLHRLLRVPEQLEICDLSPVSLSKSVQKQLRDERLYPRADSLDAAHKRDRPTFWLPVSGQKKMASCDEWLTKLVAQIARRSGKGVPGNKLASVVRFRSVSRHHALADVLGPEATLSGWTAEPDEHRSDYVEYLKQRTILELAFAGAKARGLAQLSWLAVDRGGMYYELYRREAARANKTPVSWSVLRGAAGLDENASLPDVVESQLDLCEDDPPESDADRWVLREFVPEELAKHVLDHLGKSSEKADRGPLTRALRELQSSSEIEIYAKDDRICSKAFNTPLTLPTITSLSVFTQGLFRDLDPEDEVYISCETGEWLIEDEAMYQLLSKQDTVNVLTAFPFKYGDLETKYDRRLKVLSIGPWRHNRHMTIVCKGKAPMRAVYFARRYRTPLITPVYLKQADDARRLKRAFDLMARSAEAPPAETPAEPD